MATELRWILLGLSAVLLVGICWWGSRRSRQVPTNTEWRESPTETPHHLGEEPLRAAPESRDWGVPPFEPLSIRTADFDQFQAMEFSMTATVDPIDSALTLDSAEHQAATEDTPASAPQPTFSDDWVDEPELVSQPEPPAVEALAVPQAAPVVVAAPVALPAAPASLNSSEAQRIVTVRVSAVGESRWAGIDLMAALEQNGLSFGRYKVFHRKYTDGRTLFCAASLVEPGSFDIATMPADEFRGLTLFAVLPGPADALDAIDTMIATAAELAENLDGVVQDSKGAPMTPQRAESLREDVARFQASMQ